MIVLFASEETSSSLLYSVVHWRLQVTVRTHTHICSHTVHIQTHVHMCTHRLGLVLWGHNVLLTLQSEDSKRNIGSSYGDMSINMPVRNSTPPRPQATLL